MPIAAAPVVVPPSGSFDGNDGFWSSFTIAVGTPPQSVRLLVSTKLSDVWVISESQSQDDYLATHNLAHKKVAGGLFKKKLATTWQGTRLYENGQDQISDKNIAKVEIEDYGSDATRIDLADIPNINFDSRTIATVAKGNLDLGFLGINHRNPHLTLPRDGQVSFLESLKASGRIPSLSYGFSAGAWYRNRTLGALTLGGYDNARIMPDQLSLPIIKNVDRDLVVVLESVSLSDSAGSVKTLHSIPFQVFIDSTETQLWLPEEICSQFEDAFGLLWNSTVDRYLINDTHHEILQQQNANVTFHLSSGESGETTVNITVPYSGFDLELDSPFASAKQNYFPLRRAVNPTQYILGRTFLQEAYLIVDYERSNFSISQNNWSENVTPQIVPLFPMTDNATAKSAQKSFANHICLDYICISSSLVMHAGFIPGIIVAAILVCMIVALVTYSYRRYRCWFATSRPFEDKKLGPFLEPGGVNKFTRDFSISKALRLVILHLVSSKGKSEMSNSKGSTAPSRPSLNGTSLSSRLRMHCLNGRECTCINKIRLYVESWSGEAWDWWPFCPSFEQLEGDESRLRCHFPNEPSTLPRPRHAENPKSLGRRPWTVLEKATTACEGDSPQSRSSSENSRADSLITGGLLLEGNGHFRATSKGKSTYHSDSDDLSKQGIDPSAPITAVDIVPPSNFTGFILFGVHGSQRLQTAYLRLTQIDVFDKDDDGFFDQMIVEFRRLRGFLRRIFSIWVFHTCEFITFHKANPNEIMPGPQEMPPLEDPDYYHNANRFPPVLESVFYANFYGCNKACITSHLDILCLFHQCKGRNHCGSYQVLDRLPKRVRKWEIDRDDEKEEAWGLNAVFAVSFYRVMLYHVLILTGPIIFWGLWLKKWPTDWQNASVPFFAVLVLLSLFWLPFAHNAHANRNFLPGRRI